MKSKFRICLFFIMVLLFMNGCSLAKEEAGEEAVKDKLVGALITKESLNLYDMDAFFQDNISDIMNGDSVIMSDDPKYEKRLYATVNKKQSENSIDWEVHFEGVEGMLLLCPNWIGEDGEPVIGSQGDDGICDMHTAFNVTDNDWREIVITASVFTIPQPGEANIEFHVNPVYQTANGQFYVLSGQGSSAGVENLSGFSMSQTVSDQVTTTINGEETTEKTEIKVSLSCEYPPSKITLIQMDENDRIIKEEDFEPAKMPEKIKAEKDTAYFIVKSEKSDMEGNSFATRELIEYAKDEEQSIRTYIAGDNNFLIRQYTEIDWNKTEK